MKSNKKYNFKLHHKFLTPNVGPNIYILSSSKTILKHIKRNLIYFENKHIFFVFVFCLLKFNNILRKRGK